ncbi:PepSY domain-containing protein [Luteimonas abyssi]|uniref:PepSY domain-containing protein n=1 Tax=Luteimonas abyssi TaxID=1247514 RepID=UPI000737C362|nr:PepSY domain-containing protein [Luteimonas abyssi]
MKIRPMKRPIARSLLLALALGAAVGVQAQDTMTEVQVRSALEAQGYSQVSDIKFEHGLWSADVRSADGSELDVHVDPASGEVYPDNAVANITANEVQAQLSAAGYTHIEDVEFDDGIWKAEARNPQGQKMNLRLAPTDGRILHERAD